MTRDQTKSNAFSIRERRAIKDWPISERPREKLFHLGPEGLSDGELLAVLLRIGRSGQSAEDLARQLISQFNGISGIDRAHVEELLSVPGMGIAKTAQLKAAIEIGKRARRQTAQPKTLVDIMTRLKPQQPSLCQTHAFLELAARVWREVEGNTHDAKVDAAVGLLDRIGLWLGKEGITSLLDPVSPAKQLLDTFNAAQQRVPKRVFLARWYPPEDTPHDAFHKAQLRLEQLRETLAAIEREHSIRLELIDMGTEEGGTFPIHHRMYVAIASCDIIICDLTGQRPNVFVDAGFALKHHEKNRLIFLFEPHNENDEVPFDLTTFKYVHISQAAEIQIKIRPEIIAILRDAGAPL